MQRRRHGLEPVEARDDLDYAANFLWLTFGEEADEVVVEAANADRYSKAVFSSSPFGRRITFSLRYSVIVFAGWFVSLV